MGKVLGIAIKNYGSLKDIKMGKLLSAQDGQELDNMVAIIGPSGNGKSTLADAFGFLSDSLAEGVERACDARNRGGFQHLLSQGSNGPIHFEIYYKEKSNSSPITYELSVAQDRSGRPYVAEERLRQRRLHQKTGRPLSFLHLQNGKGYAFEGKAGGQEDDGQIEGDKQEVELSDNRKLGIVTLGAMKQYTRIEKFLNFLRSWYLCYFAPDAARQLQTAAPDPYLNRDGSNLNNVAQYMFREDQIGFQKILEDIQTKIPNIRKIEPIEMQNGQIALAFWQNDFKKPFFSQRMSDGTLKLFAYYMLLHEHNPRQLVFVEEPENGLYHKYMAKLALDMKSNVKKEYAKQLFVTTHSPFFVNALSPEQVWVLSKNDRGFSDIKQAAQFEFVQDLVSQGASVGDLWYSEYFD